MKKLIAHLLFLAIVGALISRVEGLVNIASVLILIGAVAHALGLASLLGHSISDSAESTKAIAEMGGAFKDDFLTVPKRIILILVLSYFGMFAVCTIYLLGIFCVAVTKVGVKKELMQREVQS